VPRTAQARLTKKASITPRSYLFTLEVDREFATPMPGQFVHVAASEELTLRRPFSVAGVPRERSLDLLVELRGKGTRTLAEQAEGSSVSVMGPLGNWFSPPREGATAILVAGGIGVAGLRYLAEEFVHDGRPVLLLVGARTREGLLDGLMPRPNGGITLELSTDDGSTGTAGTVCELLASHLERVENPARVYACGPPAMLKEAAAVALRHGLPCEVLLEEIMACGTGACRGCVVNTKHGYKTVCSDGPVFDAAELLFEGGPYA